MMNGRAIVDAIRDNYPKPVKDGEGVKGAYCVGGAFLKALYGEAKGEAFPDVGKLARGLGKFAGWELDDMPYSDPRAERARRAAGSIIDGNDDADFTGAWAFLSKFVVGVKANLSKSKATMMARLKGLA